MMPRTPKDDTYRVYRAFDALFVSHMLRDRDFNDLNDLPPLTESQRVLMNSVPDDIVERMWNQMTLDERLTAPPRKE